MDQRVDGRAIRRAEAGDAEALADCIRTAYAQHASRIADLPDVAGHCAEEISKLQVWVAEDGGRISLAVGVTKDLTSRIKAGDLVREVSGLLGGKGGGRPDFAQAGGDDPSRLDAAFERLEALASEG